MSVKHYQRKAEPLTDGGAPMKAMRIALAAVPSENMTIAGAMDTALDAEVHKSKQLPALPYVPRMRPTLTSLLERIDRRSRRGVDMPTSNLQRFAQFLQRHRERLQTVFEECDLNGDGVVTKAELMQIMESLGVEVRMEEADAFFAEYDLDGSGALDLKELYALSYSLVAGGSRERVSCVPVW